jgi:hypothetical protein
MEEYIDFFEKKKKEEKEKDLRDCFLSKSSARKVLLYKHSILSSPSLTQCSLRLSVVLFLGASVTDIDDNQAHARGKQ